MSCSSLAKHKDCIGGKSDGCEVILRNQGTKLDKEFPGGDLEEQ